MIKKLIVPGAGIAAAVMPTLPVHAWSGAGCGLRRTGFNLLGFGRPVVGLQFAPLTSLFGMGAMLPSRGNCWGGW